jgi:hypothetical protein
MDQADRHYQQKCQNLSWTRESFGTNKIVRIFYRPGRTAAENCQNLTLDLVKLYNFSIIVWIFH